MHKHTSFSRLLKHGIVWKRVKLNIQLVKLINSLQKDKILVQSKFKAFADNKINVTKKLKCVWGRVENIVGKGENAAWLPAFLLFTLCLQKLSQHR